jgi:2,3-bisphosphoglycerate-independent phosphoglycerate mutase
MSSRPKPLVLCILDGWGERANGADNAIDRAKTPVWHALIRRWPHAHLEASEHYVGLPDGQMGNSEVGHTNIGAGRVVLQDLPRIDKALAEGKVAGLPALQDFVEKLKKSAGTAQIMGLISPGGVHSHQHQIAALAAIVADAGVPVMVHAFLDGRDTPPQSAIGYLKQFQQDLAGHGDIRIATVSGRYYAMDRDKRWDRVAKAYRVLTAAIGERADDPIKAVEAPAPRRDR